MWGRISRSRSASRRIEQLHQSSQASLSKRPIVTLGAVGWTLTCSGSTRRLLCCENSCRDRAASTCIWIGMLAHYAKSGSGRGLRVENLRQRDYLETSRRSQRPSGSCGSIHDTYLLSHSKIADSPGTSATASTRRELQWNVLLRSKDERTGDAIRSIPLDAPRKALAASLLYDGRALACIQNIGVYRSRDGRTERQGRIVLHEHRNPTLKRYSMRQGAVLSGHLD